MYKLITILFFYLFFSCQVSFGQKNENSKTNSSQNISNISKNEHLVMSVLWYQQSAEMKACYYQAYNFAKLVLDKNIAESKSILKKAVVVDIDETILDNSPFEAKTIITGIGYSNSAWMQWSDKSMAKTLPGALDFLNYAKSKNVEVFYISNRRINEIESTKKNLNALGFPYADNEHFLFKVKESSKKARRDSLSINYDILLLVGDNLGDFSELFEDRSTNMGFDAVEKYKSDFGSKFIILPNPIYGDWENAIYDNNLKISDKEKNIKRKSKLKSY